MNANFYDLPWLDANLQFIYWVSMGEGPRVNFETLVLNPCKPGKMIVEENMHIYLIDP